MIIWSPITKQSRMVRTYWYFAWSNLNPFENNPVHYKHHTSHRCVHPGQQYLMKDLISGNGYNYVALVRDYLSIYFVSWTSYCKVYKCKASASQLQVRIIGVQIQWTQSRDPGHEICPISAMDVCGQSLLCIILNSRICIQTKPEKHGDPEATQMVGIGR